MGENIFARRFYNSLNAEGYSLIEGKYVNARTHLKIRHNKCSYEYKVTPDKFRQGKRCPFCAGNVKRSQKEFEDLVHDLGGGDYVVLGTYINAQEDILMKHTVCGHLFYVRPGHFVNSGSRCTACNQSHGEQQIYSFLSRSGIRFEVQKTFEDCRNKRCLPFDFAVYDEKDEIVCLIEYQGRQHYEPVSLFGGQKVFERQLTNDEIKRVYCKDEGIPLIEIKYSVVGKEIEEMLKRELKFLGVCRFENQKTVC